MNYYNIVKKIKETSLQHKLVNEVSEGDIYEHLNSGDHKYPCVFLTVTSISNSADNDIQTINGSLFYVDRMLSDKANKLHIQSNGITTLKQVFSQLQETYDDITIGDQTYTPFEEKFADVCAGVFANFSISYENEITCSDSEYDIQTIITLTRNGVYDVMGYDTAIVNVVPVWGTIVGEITKQEDLVDFVTGQTSHIEAGTNISIDTSGVTKTINCTYAYDDSEVRELIADTTQAIEDEVEEREQADAALQAQIEDEVEEREQADAALQAQIEDEVEEREQADATLQAQIEELDDFTCGQITPTTTNFVSGTTYSIDESLQRTANLFSGQQSEIHTIHSKLGDCTTSNTAADKAFVNSTVATNAANFRGNFTQWANVPTDASGYTEDYRGTKTPTNNDYMVVQDATDYATGNTGMWRFMYIGDWATIGKNGWKPQYRVGSAFTERQQAAIDSGINSTKVAQYDAYDEDITALETDKVDKVYSSGRKIYGVGTNGEQKMYTAGTNIQLNENGTISATDTTYTNGLGIALSGTTFANSAPIFYVEGSDSDEKGIWTGTVEGLTSYYDGLTIVYVPKKGGLSSGHLTTLNLNNLGEMPLYMNTIRVTTHFGANVPVVMTYYNDAFRITDYYTSASVAVGLSTNSASTAAKTASFSYWAYKDKTYLYVTFRYANTKKAELTLNVNSTGAYPIYIDGVISSATNYTIEAGTHIMLLYNNIYWMYSDGSIPVLDGTTVNKITDLKYDDSSLSAQVTANTAAIATKQDTLVSGTNIKTINNQSLLGSGNIDIQVSVDGKVKKVSVHKGIPCAQHIGKDNETEIFGGRDGNLYFKPVHSLWTFRKLTDSQISWLQTHNLEYYEIKKLNIDERFAQIQLYAWNTYFEEWTTDMYYQNNAFIFEAYSQYSFEDFLSDNDIRQSMLKNVTTVEYIQAKDFFEIRKGNVICVREPDLYISRCAYNDVDKPIYCDSMSNNFKIFRRCSKSENDYVLYIEQSDYTTGNNGKILGNYRVLVKCKVKHKVSDNPYVIARKYARNDGRMINILTIMPVMFYQKARNGRYTSIKHFDCIGYYKKSVGAIKFIQEII